ncbi:MAG: hypothetical protein U0166_15710 [Acidobacteriota bacterium]
MTSRARCLLLATVIAPAHAFDVDDLVKEYAGKLRKARSTADRVDAAEWLGGRTSRLRSRRRGGALRQGGPGADRSGLGALEDGREAAAARPALLGAPWRTPTHGSW